MFAAALGLTSVPEAVRAQDGLPGVTKFVTLDRDRLFQGTRYGRRVIEQLAIERQRLAEETQELERALEAEELALTEARKTLSPDEFRAKADAFDEKVVALRVEAEAASARFAALRTAEQRKFEESIVDILGRLVADLGAVAIVDRSVILLSTRNIDITELAIARIDSALGDGTGLEDGSEVAPEAQSDATGATPPEDASSAKDPGQDN